MRNVASREPIRSSWGLTFDPVGYRRALPADAEIPQRRLALLMLLLFCGLNILPPSHLGPVQQRGAQQHTRTPRDGGPACWWVVGGVVGVLGVGEGRSHEEVRDLHSLLSLLRSLAQTQHTANRKTALLLKASEKEF